MSYSFFRKFCINIEVSFKSLAKGMGVSFFILLTPQLSGTVYLAPTPQFKPRVEIAVVYIEYNDLTLILHRQEHKPQGDKWGIPGGKIDKNETPLQAAIREVREETGLDISNQAIEELATVYVEYNEKDHFVHHMFRTQLQADPASVKINFNEHKGFTWVTPATALQMNLMQDEDYCFRLVYAGSV